MLLRKLTSNPFAAASLAVVHRVTGINQKGVWLGAKIVADGGYTAA